MTDDTDTLCTIEQADTLESDLKPHNVEQPLLHIKKTKIKGLKNDKEKVEIIKSTNKDKIAKKSSAGDVDKTNKHTWTNSAPAWKPSKAIKKILAENSTRHGSYTAWGDVPKKRRVDLKKKIYHYIHLSKSERERWLNDFMTAQKSNGVPYPALKGQQEVIANTDIKPWTLIGHYAGILYTSESYEKNGYPIDTTNLYAIDLADGNVLSGFKESNICSLINACYDYNPKLKQKVKANVQYTYHRDKHGRQYVMIITLCKIKEGSALWVDYGKQYWE